MFNALELNQPFEAPNDLSGVPEDAPNRDAIRKLENLVNNYKLSADIREEAQRQLNAQIATAKNNDFFEIPIDNEDFVQDPSNSNRFIGPTITWQLGSDVATVTSPKSTKTR